MKKYLLSSIKLTIALIILLSVIYPLIIAFAAKYAPGGGDGVTVMINGKIVGYENVAQAFKDDKYFQPRPSANNYNANGSGGSNKGPSDSAYLKQVQDRIDTFMAHNPGIIKQDIPAELVTASGSGLDPDLSPAATRIQVKRIAAIRHLPEDKLMAVVDAHTQKPLLGLLGPSKVNVLKLNIDLDKIK